MKDLVLYILAVILLATIVLCLDAALGGALEAVKTNVWMRVLSVIRPQ